MAGKEPGGLAVVAPAITPAARAVHSGFQAEEVVEPARQLPPGQTAAAVASEVHSVEGQLLRAVEREGMELLLAAVALAATHPAVALAAMANSRSDGRDRQPTPCPL